MRYKSSKPKYKTKRIKEKIPVYLKNNKKHRSSLSKIKKKSIKKQKIEIDSSMILLLIEFFLKQGLITQEELKSLTLNKDNPIKEIEVKIKDQVLSKNQLRDLWLYQMRHHELFCSICGNEIKSEGNHNNPWRLTAEHRIPKSKGGKTDSTNLDSAHSYCNSLKTNYMPEEWEKIGLAILQSRGIPVDFKKTIYNYTLSKGR